MPSRRITDMQITMDSSARHRRNQKPLQAPQNYRMMVSCGAASLQQCDLPVCTLRLRLVVCDLRFRLVSSMLKNIL
jgi:hypothetical protein